MTALLLFTGFAIILLLAVFLWPTLKSRAIRKPQAKNDPPRFMEEYTEELTAPLRHEDLKDPVPELPRSYNVDRLVLLVRDPYWIYAYWEISAAKMEEIAAGYEPWVWGPSRPVLRVYDVTGVDFNGSNANSFFDCSLNELAENWYINVPRANRTYCADLGRLLPDGSFITILRSNPVTTPRDALSDNLDEEWMWIEGIYRTIKYQTGVSSPMIVEEINDRMGKAPLGFSSPGFKNPDYY
ncbi:MAG: DUF4912 domain-containing protein [Peptococcaceae bacterium]|nr:DUF4912 domain-containing protein [Peptococcaceae bacterium]